MRDCPQKPSQEFKNRVFAFQRGAMPIGVKLTFNLTPRLPSRHGKGEKTPLSVSERGRGRGQKDEHHAHNNWIDLAISLA